MSIDYGEKERQFLATLKADTGRSLDEWMAAIGAAGLTHRNDIIDWLRREGFMFSKASWIERIHNNGGRPIYGDAGAGRMQRPRRRPALSPSPSPASAAPTDVAGVPSEPIAAAPAPQPAPPPAAQRQDDGAALDALLQRAKAFRPLAVFLIAEIRKALPDVMAIPRHGHVLFRHGNKDAAVLAISGRDLRLGLALQRLPAGVTFETPRFPAARGAPPMSHMIVLTDVRQITPALLGAVAQAATDI